MYSKEIDGLRGVSVLLVILFHVDEKFVPGGYVGVDVFFVISGYLITNLILPKIKAGDFSFFEFYCRRCARLLPAILVMFAAVFLFGFLFYGNSEMDSLGRDLFFSALGIKNIIDSQGINYFVQDETVKPLLHIWSLGVEEQFYVVWPVTLLLLIWASSKHALVITLSGTIVFLAVSVYGTMIEDPVMAYFLPWYRAYELMIGVCGAMLVHSKMSHSLLEVDYRYRNIISAFSFCVILASATLLSKDSAFPGFNALYPTLAAMVLVFFVQGTFVGQLLASRMLVFIGLISYPLYLLHLPIISWLRFFNSEISSIVVLSVVLVAGIASSFLIYKYIEQPIRKMARIGNGFKVAIPLVAFSLVFAGAGLYTAKVSGLPQRMAILNPFAHAISESLKSTFHEKFARGINRSSPRTGRVLFFGDSLLQQYVVPLSKAWNIPLEDIDIVSRGGCVLLKGVEFDDSFSDISCSVLRQDLYTIEHKYERVVFSQAWLNYGKAVTNALAIERSYAKIDWLPFISETISVAKSWSDNVYVIGPHIYVEGTGNIKIGPMLKKRSFTKISGKFGGELTEFEGSYGCFFK